MSFLGVSIDCVTPKSPKISASGLRICEHFILTHSSIIWHIVKEPIRENINSLFVDKNFMNLQNILTQRTSDSSSKFSVALTPEHSNMNSEWVSEEHSAENFENSSKLPFEKPPVLYVEACVEQVIISPCLIFEFLNLLYQRDRWKFDKSEINENPNNKYLDCVYLSTFLLLRTKEISHIDKCFAQFEELTSNPKKGTTVFIDGCPFGFESARAVFLNSLSRGIISNISHAGNIFLTDARCIIGCEGAPAYSLEHRFRVCGIVLSPFCWLKGEWVGLTFMAAIKPLLSYMRSTLEPSSSVELYPMAECSPTPILVSGCDGATSFQIDDETLSCNPSSIIKEARLIPDVVNVINRCIVRIIRKSSDDWGTGIVVTGTKGLVVTCAHVTRGAVNKVVDVVFCDGKCQKGIVIFESSPHLQETTPSSQQGCDFDVWDLALVQLPFQPRHSLPLSKELPAVGTPVIIGGHPLFRAEALSSPTFSLGCLAKVTNVFRRATTFERTSESPSCPGIAPFCPALAEGFVCSYWHQCALSDDAIPVALQTTCAVYSGVSGGPVVALHPGKGAVVIGIVSCCARDVESKVCFPHVNMATPAFLLSEVVDRFSVKGDFSIFDSLKFKSPSGLSIWKLRNALKSKL